MNNNVPNISVKGRFVQELLSKHTYWPTHTEPIALPKPAKFSVMIMRYSAKYETVIYDVRQRVSC